MAWRARAPELFVSCVWPSCKREEDPPAPLAGSCQPVSRRIQTRSHEPDQSNLCHPLRSSTFIWSSAGPADPPHRGPPLGGGPMHGPSGEDGSGPSILSPGGGSWALANLGDPGFILWRSRDCGVQALLRANCEAPEYRSSNRKIWAAGSCGFSYCLPFVPRSYVSTALDISEVPRFQLEDKVRSRMIDGPLAQITAAKKGPKAKRKTRTRNRPRLLTVLLLGALVCDLPPHAALDVNRVSGRNFAGSSWREEEVNR